MAEPQSPGIRSRERRADFISIAGSPTSIGSFVIASSKGPIASPTLITSPEQLRRIFGAYIPSSYGLEAVNAFFENGGSSCWVLRTAHYTDITDSTTLTAVAADADLPNGTPTNVLNIAASSEGVFGNDIAVTLTHNDILLTTTAEAMPITTPITNLLLTSASRVRIGDTLLLDDSSNVERVVVTAVNGNRVSFTSIVPAATIASGATVTSETFDMGFYEGGVLTRTEVELRMVPTSLRFVENVVKSEDDPEALFTADATTVTPSPTVDARPVAIIAPGTALSSGSDGSPIVSTDFVGSAAGRTGLYSFTKEVVPMLSIPGEADAVINQGIEAFVETTSTRTLGVLEFPTATTPTAALALLTTTWNLQSDNLAIYYPWVRVTDPTSGVVIPFPPSGHVQGRYAATDAKRTIAKAPAGTVDGKLLNVRGVEYAVSEGEYDLLYPKKINAILPLPEGTTIFGSRTLGASDQLGQIGPRRVMNYAIDSIEKGTRFITFEFNDTATRAKWKRSVEAFCLQMWRAGMLEGASAAEAFYVVCDETNNPASLAAAGKFAGTVGLHFKQTIEFADYVFEKDTRAIKADLASQGLS